MPWTCLLYNAPRRPHYVNIAKYYVTKGKKKIRYKSEINLNLHTFYMMYVLMSLNLHSRIDAWFLKMWSFEWVSVALPDVALEAALGWSELAVLFEDIQLFNKDKKKKPSCDRLIRNMNFI